ncbi:minor capsid protein [Lactococcus ileimucosae]|uniref:minor capsid protein n=1 Tax=Lactococcus ileimucosae TaxID=2941329 RepID=UPI0020443D44|nr:minor capsid protein [Lactococcus ileimucosae]
MKKKNNYWAKREHENIINIKKREKEFAQYVKSEYQETIQNINFEIERQLNRYLESEKISMADFMKAADKMDVKAFNKKAEQYVRTKNFSQKANAELKLYNLKMRVNRLELLKAKLLLELDQLHRRLEPKFKEFLIEEGIIEYQRQAGILGNSVNIDKKLVEKLVNGSFNNANWSTRLWINIEDTRGVLKKSLNELLLRGVNPSKFSMELMRLMHPLEVSRNSALRLLITESANIQLSVQLDSFSQAGFKEYEFVTEPSACNQCAPLSGKIFSIGNANVGENRAPIHPFCRCSSLPYESESRLKDILGKGYWKRRKANVERKIKNNQ